MAVVFAVMLAMRGTTPTPDSNASRRLMSDWLPHKVAAEYAMSADWDDRWRTGGSVEEIVLESRIDPDSLWKGIERFARERDARLARLRV